VIEPSSGTIAPFSSIPCTVHALATLPGLYSTNLVWDLAQSSNREQHSWAELDDSVPSIVLPCSARPSGAVLSIATHTAGLASADRVSSPSNRLTAATVSWPAVTRGAGAQCKRLVIKNSSPLDLMLKWSLHDYDQISQSMDRIVQVETHCTADGSVSISIIAVRLPRADRSFAFELTASKMLIPALGQAPCEIWFDADKVQPSNQQLCRGVLRAQMLVPNQAAIKQGGRLTATAMSRQGRTAASTTTVGGGRLPPDRLWMNAPAPMIEYPLQVSLHGHVLPARLQVVKDVDDEDAGAGVDRPAAQVYHDPHLQSAEAASTAQAKSFILFNPLPTAVEFSLSCVLQDNQPGSSRFRLVEPYGSTNLNRELPG